jgi:hypothetical protein
MRILIAVCWAFRWQHAEDDAFWRWCIDRLRKEHLLYVPTPYRRPTSLVSHNPMMNPAVLFSYRT